MSAGSRPTGTGQREAGSGGRSSAGRRAASGTPSAAKFLLGAVIAVVIVGLLFLMSGGCGQKIEAAYGRRKGAFWSSVNGTGVLGDMFEDAGHTVFSWGMLTPRLRQQADCIVWFPNDFSPPSPDVCDWLEHWLREQPGRTLIYVGRDFDASVWYWEQMLPNAPPDQKAEFQRRRNETRRQFNSDLRRLTAPEDSDWFTIKPSQHREVTTLKGDPKWVEGVDASKVEIELNHRMVPSGGAQTLEVLLESEGDMLVARRQFDRSQLIVVANGSFLLNLPLVNHEHRKLAGRLIEAAGPPRQTVVFLESYPGGPMIFEADPTSVPPSALAIFNIWPTSWILLHLAAAGILFCFYRFPIFGRPREPEPEGTSDFGRHIEALGKLLERSGERETAAARLAQYRQLTRGDSAAPVPTRPRRRSDQS